MKKIFLLITIAVPFLSGCNLRAKLKKEAEVSMQNVPPEVIEARKLLGAYTGSIGTAKISLLITKTSADSIEGRSVVGGKDHVIIGSLKKANGHYTIVASEKKKAKIKRNEI